MCWPWVHVAVVSMGFQVNEDFKTDAPTAVKVLNIITIVAAGIGFGAEALNCSSWRNWDAHFESVCGVISHSSCG